MNQQHPIEGLMTTAMNNIKDMVDVNTIIGEPIETSNNVVIIPISKVSFGFAAGGSEFKGETIGEYTKKDKEEEIQYNLPFGGGAGAGVNINPVAFIVIQGNGVKLLPVEHCSSIDRLLDYMPDIMDKANNIMNKLMQDKKEEKCKPKQETKQKKEEAKEKNEQTQEKVVRRTRPQRNVTNPNIVYEYEYDEQPHIEQEIPIDDYDEE
jgi:sporulation protein YtfJ